MVHILQIYTKSSLRNFTYLIIGKEYSYCLDPYLASQVIDNMRAIRGELKHEIKLSAIINTHEHWDHTKGNRDLREATNCQIWAHKNASGQIAGMNHGLEAGDKLPLGEDYHLQVLYTPGHTFAHLCLLLIDPQGQATHTFTGDTLFNGGVGNCHNGGDANILYHTIKEQLETLDDKVILYPGHEYWENNLRFTLSREPGNSHAQEMLKKGTFRKGKDRFHLSTIGEERQVNTFLRRDQEEIRQILSTEGMPVETDQEVFVSLRNLRNQW